MLAELGIKPEDAAVTLRAAKEALLRVMPDILPFALFVLVLFVFALSHIEKQAALSYRLISAILATLMLLLAF